MKTILWLDDCRDPKEWKDYIRVLCPVTSYYLYDIVWCQTYNKFVTYINTHGLPDAICFDHDLGDLPEQENSGYKSGYDAAKYLVKFCEKHNLKLPEYGTQSSNPPGRENILSLLNTYKKYVQGEN